MLASIFLMIHLCDLQWSVTEYKDIFYSVAELSLKFVEPAWCKHTGKYGLLNLKRIFYSKRESTAGKMEDKNKGRQLSRKPRF